MKTTATVIIGVTLASGVSLAQRAKPSLAIRTFENPANHSSSNIGNALTEIVTTELAKTGKFRLLERLAVDELLKEHDFAKTDRVDKATSAQKGKLAGAEYFLMGKVTNFSFQEREHQVQVPEREGLRYQKVYVQQADVRLDFRLVSTKTGEIVLSESGEARNALTSGISALQYWNRCLREGFTFTTTEGMSSLIGRTSVDAVKRLAQKLNELSRAVEVYASTDAAAPAASSLAGLQGRVLAVLSPSDFVVSIGSKAGLQQGRRLLVSIEVPLFNQKREEIYREQKDIATVEVVDLETSGTRAKVRLVGHANAAIQEGHLVKVDGGSDNSLGPTPAPRVPPARSPAEAAAPFVKKGDVYFEGGHLVQALEQYQEAYDTIPEDFDLLEKLSSVHLYLGNWLETEEFAERILNLNYDVVVPAAHRHFSDCEGMLRLSKGRLRFEGKDNDHRFSATRSELLNITAGDSGWLELRVRMPDGKAKQFTLLPLLFASGGRNQISTLEHTVRPNQFREHRRLLNLLVRLIQKYL